MTAVLDGLKTFFWWVLEHLLSFFEYITWFLWDLFCSIVEFAFSLIEIPAALVGTLFQWVDLPSQVQYLLNALGFQQVITILIAAITLRVLMNLIPGVFTRV